MNSVDEIDAILDYGSRSNSYNNSRVSHRKSMDSGGWDFEVMTLKKNASHSSYDEYGYGVVDNASKSSARRDQGYNSLRSSRSSNSNSSPSIHIRNTQSGSSASSANGSVVVGNTNSLRKLQIRQALMRAESDVIDDGCKESKYIDGMIAVSINDDSGDSEVKEDTKDLGLQSSSLQSFSSPRSPSSTTSCPDFRFTLQCLQKILERNQKLLPSDLYNGVLDPTLCELERLTDEMKGDSEATRQETKILISLLKTILIALDKHTDGGLISSFISTVIGFAMEDGEDDLENTSEQDPR